jgi:hypothetical protein
MKAILIARVSTEEQKEAGNSLPVFATAHPELVEGRLATPQHFSSLLNKFRPA